MAENNKPPLLMKNTMYIILHFAHSKNQTPFSFERLIFSLSNCQRSSSKGKLASLGIVGVVSCLCVSDLIAHLSSAILLYSVGTEAEV